MKNIPRYECLLEASKLFPEMNPSATEAFMNVLYAGDELVRVLGLHFHKHHLSQGRFVVLMILFRHLMEQPSGSDPALTPAQLAEQANVTRATMTGLVDSLERDDLVSREQAADDRRMMRVRLTAQGQRFVQEFFPVHCRRIAELLSGLTEAESHQLVTLLRKITDRTSVQPGGLAAGTDKEQPPAS